MEGRFVAVPLEELLWMGLLQGKIAVTQPLPETATYLYTYTERGRPYAVFHDESFKLVPCEHDIPSVRLDFKQIEVVDE